jgi:L,D-peptidoglycan transpeptidase YkuD (ErfK/YbiS/YcfS/YnhG family)
MDIEVFPPSTLRWRGRDFTCVLGKGGARADKREGDGATPTGRFLLRRVFYRPDRLAAPASKLPVVALAHSDGWCDDPTDAAYNRPVALPYPAGHEELWRADAVYDVIVQLGHNDDPVVKGAGSAVFMHVARPDRAPTEGCVALSLDDLLLVLEDCGPETAIVIHSPA